MREISTIKKNILQYLDFKGISKYEFYQKTGVSNGVLSQNSGMSEENTLRFLSYYKDVSAEWLLTGIGEMFKTKSKENVLKKNEDNNEDKKGDKPNVKKTPPMEMQISEEYSAVIRKIKFADGVSLVDEGAPFYPLPVSAGTVAELIQEDEKPTGYVSIPGLSCKAYFPVIGFSFGDIIPAGSIIGVDFINSWETLDPDCVYFIVTTDQRMAKRLVADPDNPNNLICLSPNYQSFKISKDDIKVIHKVIFVGKPV